MKRGFTLIELIVVIIIVGILAAVGLTQYSTTVEKSRLAEAKIRIGAMRQLAYEYYLNNGTLTGITYSDVGVNYTCSSTNFYSYWIGTTTSTRLDLAATRCFAGGKSPNVSRQYTYWLQFYPGSGVGVWHCAYIPSYTEPCFGLPPWTG